MKKTLTCLVCAAAGMFGWSALSAQQTPTATAPDTTSEEGEVELEELRITERRSFSDAAIPGETPIAFTEVTKETLSAELGSRDIPLALNTTPSVYATTDGGAAGDARVNVRGFNQRNVSILINGVPTNDIENGWLYWSNWDGLGDVTSTIQVQRGMSNVTLPTPSIGGTMNIITDPAAARHGGSLKVEVGGDGFLKGTAVYNTGLLGEKFAATIGFVAKEGDGYVDGGWTKGMGYYLGLSYQINDANRLELYAIGAPQQHGQRRFASNIAAYSESYARNEFGYTDADILGALARGPVNAGKRWNPNYAPVSASYTGKQYYWGGTHNRELGSFMNESVNYFHKPQLNLNWYSRLSDTIRLDSVLYYSGGDGGGSGTLNNGSSSVTLPKYPASSPLNGNINWDETILRNQNNVVNGDSVSRGILRNSVNQQDQFGLVSKLNWEATESLTLTTGVDWRTAEIDHYREVRDLLGGDYYLPTAAQASQFWANGTSTQLGLGDKVDYFNTNTVDWVGLFVQGKYEKDALKTFFVYGYSMIEYGYTDVFRRAAPGSDQMYTIEAETLDGQQVKGGVNYAINDQVSIYGNAGWVSKVPVFDGVINDVTGVALDPENEKFTSVEAGVRFETKDRKFNISTGLYYTEWRDRTISSVNEQANTVTYQRGVNSNYTGVEIESAWKPLNWLRFDFAASIADWWYTDDAPFETFDITTGDPVTNANLLYLKDLKVGDAPQTQFAYAATFFPIDGLSVKVQGTWYDRYWADYDPATRTNASDRGQAWQIPSYSVYDLHVNYTLPLKLDRTRISVFVHAFNIFDEMYVSDATDNSGFEGIAGAPSHSAQRAEVFLGAPFTINGGVKLTF